MEGKVSLEIVCRDLQRMIREEARSAALAGETYRGRKEGWMMVAGESVRERARVCVYESKREREWVCMRE